MTVSETGRPDVARVWDDAVAAGPVLAPARPAGSALLVGSSGGHLAQLLALRALWPAERRVWVTFDTPDAVSLLRDEQVFWAHHPTTRSLRKLIRNTLLAWRVLRRSRPSVVISSGAAVALPFFVLARLRGIPTVYVEVYDRMDTATLTGRLCHPFTSLFLVQWEEQRALYRDAVVVGPLL
jgi:UDP-N-acetylglucosamine:LPS N-acetylglucosamine transferase